MTLSCRISNQTDLSTGRHSIAVKRSDGLTVDLLILFRKIAEL